MLASMVLVVVLMVSEVRVSEVGAEVRCSTSGGGWHGRVG